MRNLLEQRVAFDPGPPIKKPVAAQAGRRDRLNDGRGAVHCARAIGQCSHAARPAGRGPVGQYASRESGIGCEHE